MKFNPYTAVQGDTLDEYRNVLGVLLAVQALFKDPNKFVRPFDGMTAQGSPCSPNYSDAIAWSLVGAVLKCDPAYDAYMNTPADQVPDPQRVYAYDKAFALLLHDNADQSLRVSGIKDGYPWATKLLARTVTKLKTRIAVVEGEIARGK